MQKLSSYIDAGLQKKVKTLHRLTLSIGTRLPVELAHRCWVAGIENRTLTIIADNPDLASLIRFQQHEVLKQINQELGLSVKEHLRRIKIKISMAASDIEPPVKPMQLSRFSAQTLRECAKNLQDPDLKKTLERLSMRDK